MPSYAGVTFSIQKEVPARTWQRPYQWSRRAIPFSTTEDVQYLGAGKFSLTLPVVIEAGADVVTLRNAVGETGRTLSDFRAGSYNGVRLLSVSNERIVQGSETIYLADLEFVWEG